MRLWVLLHQKHASPGLPSRYKHCFVTFHLGPGLYLLSRKHSTIKIQLHGANVCVSCGMAPKKVRVVSFLAGERESTQTPCQIRIFNPLKVYKCDVLCVCSKMDTLCVTCQNVEITRRSPLSTLCVAKFMLARQGRVLL